MGKRPGTVCPSCGGEMKSLGYSQLQKGQYSYFLGHFDNWASGALAVETMLCSDYGKLELYRYDLVNRDQKEEVEDEVPMVSCSRCGSDYEANLKECPRCGSPNLTLPGIR